MKRTYKIFVSIILVISVLLISAVPAFAGGVEMEDMPDEPIKPQVETNGESSGGKTEETTSTTEPEDKDNEGEFVIPSEEIHLPILDIR